jgi:hemoglobin
MKRTGVWGSVGLLVVSLALAACASMGSQTTSTSSSSPSLYRRLGGRDGIAGVVDAFWANALADPRIGPRFKAIPAAKAGPVRTNIADFICENTGGPCAYGGRTMQESHKGMNLTKDDVDACNAALAKALDSKGVTATEKNELMALVQGLMPSLVNQ